MEIKESVLEIEGVKYNFTEADVFKAKFHAELLLSIARGAIKIDIKGGEGEGLKTSIDPAEVLANITTPEAQKIQDFIWDSVIVVKDGAGVMFDSKANRSIHLGKHRSHIYPIILFGAKFHFLDFLPTGEEFAKSTFGQAINKAVASLK